MILLVVPLNLWRPVVVLDIAILKSLFLLLKIHTYIWNHDFVGFLPFDLWDFLKMEFSSSLLIPNFFDQPRRFPFPTSSTCSSFSSRASNYHSNFEKIKKIINKKVNELQISVQYDAHCPPIQVEQIPLAEQGGTVVHRFSESHHGKHLRRIGFNRKLFGWFCRPWGGRWGRRRWTWWSRGRPGWPPGSQWTSAPAKSNAGAKRYLRNTRFQFFSLVPCREEHGAGRHGQAGACWENEIHIIRIGSIWRLPGWAWTSELDKEDNTWWAWKEERDGRWTAFLAMCSPPCTSAPRIAPALG